MPFQPGEYSGSGGLGLLRLAHKRPSGFFLVLWERHLSCKSEYTETLMPDRPHAGVSEIPGGSGINCQPHECTVLNVQLHQAFLWWQHQPASEGNHMRDPKLELSSWATRLWDTVVLCCYILGVICSLAVVTRTWAVTSGVAVGRWSSWVENPLRPPEQEVSLWRGILCHPPFMASQHVSASVLPSGWH